MGFPGNQQTLFCCVDKNFIAFALQLCQQIKTESSTFKKNIAMHLKTMVNIKKE